MGILDVFLQRKKRQEERFASSVRETDEETVRKLKSDPKKDVLDEIELELDKLAGYLGRRIDPHDEEYPEFRTVPLGVHQASRAISKGDITLALLFLSEYREMMKKIPRPWPDFIRECVKAIGKTESTIYEMLPAEGAIISDYVLSCQRNPNLSLALASPDTWRRKYSR